MDKTKSRKAQVSIFVIIAIVIVAIILVFFAFRSNIFGLGIPAEFRPVYSIYDECITYETESAIALLSSQGGRIETGPIVPGSEYAPFSSHLDFLGTPVPYWFSLSGNNIIKESVPTIGEMEDEISTYIEEKLNNCDFSSFYSQGFYIEMGEPTVETTINEESVEVSVSADVVASIEDRSARKTSHEVQVNSRLGKFHQSATELYEKQRNEAFLETYAIDVIRLYAPVDGVEVQCTPQIWKTQEVVDEIYQGLETNVQAIKFRGDYYSLGQATDNYFVVNHEVDEAVNLLYMQDWPSKIEIFGDGVSQSLMVAEPIGNQEGMGIMGFCYVPYHYVYDVSFPVMFQIHDGLEFFQFPVVVIIDGNLPRVADLNELELEREEPTFDICDFAENPVSVRTFDYNLNPVAANISYQCFDRKCPLGETGSEGSSDPLNALAPACVNGVLIAEAEGYSQSKLPFSTNAETEADLILQREFELEIDYNLLDASKENSNAIIHFSGQNGKVSALLPETKTIKLSEGLYNVTMHVYGNSNVVIPASTKVECVDVAKSGVLGLFGGTKEECIEVTFPEVKIENALIGGGKTSTYILESQLAEGKLVIEGSSLPPVTSMEQLQYNFEVFDSLGVDLRFE